MSLRRLKNKDNSLDKTHIFSASFFPCNFWGSFVNCYKGMQVKGIL